MNCWDKVPWIDGKPKDICKLDDMEQLKKFKIQLDISLKRGDYYVHKNNDRWLLVERKDGKSDIRNAIMQLKSTFLQLKKQNKPVNQLIIIFERISKTESRMFRRNQDDKFLVSLASPNRNQINIEGVSVELYYVNEVNELRSQGRL